jgi:hypothetical protein
MKKIYMIPSLEVTKIQTQNMIALSEAGINPDTEVINTQEKGAITPGMSRRSVWDDEDFDEE